jgi:hypothetical protein
VTASISFTDGVELTKDGVETIFHTVKLTSDGVKLTKNGVEKCIIEAVTFFCAESSVVTASISFSSRPKPE